MDMPSGSTSGAPRSFEEGVRFVHHGDRPPPTATVPGDPVFKPVFGPDWDTLPQVMRNHYAVRANSADRVVVTGTLDVHVSRLAALLATITGMLVRHSGKNIPVTVTFTSGSGSTAFNFDRLFHYPEHGEVRFRSRMKHTVGDEIIELMKFGIGWRAAYGWDDSKVTLSHRGYVWHVFGRVLPLPLTWLLGRVHAEETPIDDRRFSMFTHMTHPVFGKLFGYAGTFTITEVSCAPS